MASIQLISVSDLKTELGIAATEETHDALLQTKIQQVSARFETYLDRLLKAEERTKLFDNGPATFFLPAYPVDTDEAFTVTIDDVEQEIGDDFYLYAEEGKVVFPCGTGSFVTPQSVKVVYTGGYDEDAPLVPYGEELVLGVPDDLKRACTMQAVFDFRRRNDTGLSSISMPDGNIAISQGPSGLLAEVRYILKSYRRLVF